MKEYPHRYEASATAPATGEITVSSPRLESLPSLAPAEFGGPGDLWSPETLLVAAVADCLILTFRAVARASRLEWNSIQCDVAGILDRVDNVTRFTEYHIHVTLHVPQGSDTDKADRLLEKSDHVCLVSNSLNGKTLLETHIVVDA